MAEDVVSLRNPSPRKRDIPHGASANTLHDAGARVCRVFTRQSQMGQPDRFCPLTTREARRLVELIAFGLRHIVVLITGAVDLVVWQMAAPAGPMLSATLVVWSVARLVTRRSGPVWLIADTAIAVGYICWSPSLLEGGVVPATAGSGSVAVAMIISVGLVARTSVTVAVTASTLAALIVGWSVVGYSTLALGYGLVLAAEWALTVWIGRMVRRASQLADEALTEGNRAHVARQVSLARRSFEREQWALLHDTAASTLLMVGQGVAVDPARLAAQAKRDLATLELVPLDDTGTTIDLVAQLATLVVDFPIAVRFSGTKSLELDEATARTVVAAAREAFNNVERHANAQTVVVHVEDRSLAISDDGIGFSSARERIAARHGVRNSIIARLQHIGGAATVSSAPGRGTAVRMTWPARSDESTAPAPIADPAGGIARIQRALGYGVVMTAGLMALFSVPPPGVAGTEPTWLLPVLMATNVAGILFAAYGIRRSWPPVATWLVIALVFAVAPLQGLFGESIRLIAGTSWTLLALTFRCRLPVSLAVVVASWIAAFGVASVRSVEGAGFAVLGYSAAGSGSLLIFITVLADMIRRAERTALAETNDRARLAAAQAVEDALQRDYRRRYDDLSKAVVPLLRGLASAQLSSVDPAVRATARVEDARMRRLFAQSASFDHPLLQELQPSIDIAERNGATITFDIAADVPDIPATARTELLVAPSMLLADSRSRARIVVASSATDVTISVVCDCGADAIRAVERLPGDAAFELITLADETWLKVRHPLAELSKRT